MKQLFYQITQINRSTLAWTGLAFAAVILLSVNVISSSLLKNLKADLTEKSLFTISDGTKDILKKIDEPIDVKVYYSKALGERAPTYGKYFERVKALLEQYRGISDGKLQLTFLEPEPFTDAEDRAVASGLNGVRLNEEGDTGYFGLVATNSTDNKKTIPFFSPERESFLEYDLSKLLHNLANPDKPIIGLIAGLPVNGDYSPRGQYVQPWIVMEQIREFFDVKNLKQDIEKVPDNIDTLMIIQPEKLTKQAAYAIDQFALGGGKVMAFVDPVAEYQRATNPGLEGVDATDEFSKLLKTWGCQI